MVVAIATGLGGVSESAADDAAAPPQSAPAEVRAVLHNKAKPAIANATLIGRSGQIYEPTASGWKRIGRGGVACAVTDAMRAGGRLWALCSRAPMFARDRGVWSAKPLANRGRTRSARIAKTPLFSVGRHLYTWRGGGWQRVASAPSRITSLLAQSATRGFAITSRKELLRVSGKSWKVVIDAPKRARRGRAALEVDSPTRLFGSAKHAYVVLESGAILAIAGGKKRPVKLPAPLSNYGVGAFCTGAKGEVITLGRTARGGNSDVVVLSWKGQAATAFGAAPVLAAGERIGILHCDGAELLVSTDRGRILVRNADGVWAERTLDATPPAETKRVPAGAKPATSQ